MKVLIVAHPDDEILWFAPEKYDKIIIVFSGREDKPWFKDLREQAVMEHPLNVECWCLTESNFWRDPTKYAEYEQNYKDLVARLKRLEADSVDTHNAYGEYGHADHILIHNACMETLNCPVNGKNPEVYRKIKKLYQDKDIWTWNG